MRKKANIIIALLCLCGLINTVLASPIREQRLVGLAAKAFAQKLNAAGRSGYSAPQDYRLMVENNDTLMLVMNFKEGFIVLSADDAVTPVLAYSLDQQLDLDDMAPAARMWLNMYANQIKEAKHNEWEPTVEISQRWIELDRQYPSKSTHEEIVSPLITAQWNQTQYYNAYSPYEPDAPGGYDLRTPNGCVAVAMAMIMYYYRYPIHGAGSHTNHTDYGDFFVDFSQQTYFYEAMRDNLDFYNNEVAKLIFHCGTSVDMMYGPDGSGAYSQDVPFALTNYFGYGPDCEYISRHSYSLSQWKNVLKTELDAKRPVYYSGCSDDGCHAFVCDGYDDADYFHFNFGWGGSSNGFYVLSATDSDSVVIGGYNHSQHAVIGIYPSEDKYPYYCPPTSYVKCQKGTLEDGSGISDYENNSHCTTVITEDDAYRVHVSFSSFDTQAGHDILSFWDGHPAQNRPLRACSGYLPSGTSYSFDTDSLYIVFETDDSITATGWRLNYQVDRHETTCHSNVLHDYRGTLSDGSGDSPYKSNANCYWRISLPRASYITISFSYFDLGDGDCITIYDRTVFPKSPLAVYSGHSLPEPRTFNSNFISIEFYSDNFVNGDGFELHWNSDYSPAGVEEVIENDVLLYPNPVSGILHVKTPSDAQEVSLLLYDVAGRQVKNVKLQDSDELDVDVADLPNGYYTVLVRCGKQSYRKKLIIQR